MDGQGGAGGAITRPETKQLTHKNMKINLPSSAYRAAIHNQIYNSRYYHVSRYERNPATGKLAYAECWGYRSGKRGGLHLGMSPGEARDEARTLNRKHGWGDIPTDQRPKWLLA